MDLNSVDHGPNDSNASNNGNDSAKIDSIDGSPILSIFAYNNSK